MRGILALFICGILVCGLMGCDKLAFLNPAKKTTANTEQAQPASAAGVKVKGTVIAKVNNMPITLEDLNQETAAFNNMVAERQPEMKISTRDQKLDYLKKEMVRRVLLYQDGLARGLDRKEEILEALEKARQDLVVMELVRQETDKVEVSSKEVEDYYNSYKEQMKEPEERQVRQIAVATEQEAKDIAIQLLQGTDFATLARDKSKSKDANNGGDMGYIKKGDNAPQFDAVAFSDTLEVGKISSIFKGPDGYYIVKLEAKRGGKTKTLSEMFDDIKKMLTFLKQQRKVEEIIGKLSRDAKIEIYESEVK